jgi:hypothetical protein
MTAHSPWSLAAWALGAALVSGPAAGQSAATSPKGQVAGAPAQRPPGAVLAAPATPANPGAVAPATDPAASEKAPAMSAGQARGALERGLTELGELAARARQSGDMVRIACVQDKQERANAVVEVATGDLVVAADAAADAQTRAFAGEKLGEAVQQLQGLVSKARACTGKEEAGRTGVSNDSQVPQVVLPQDPTGPTPPASRGLPPIDPRPPVASPVL